MSRLIDDQHKKCGNCYYLQKINDERGICLRYPPVAVTDWYGMYPEVLHTNTCGEFKDVQDILVQPYDALQLQQRTLSGIEQLNKMVKPDSAKPSIATVGDLILYTADDFLEVKHFGVTSLQDIRIRLAAFGLKLTDD